MNDTVGGYVVVLFLLFLFWIREQTLPTAPRVQVTPLPIADELLAPGGYVKGVRLGRYQIPVPGYDPGGRTSFRAVPVEQWQDFWTICVTPLLQCHGTESQEICAIQYFARWDRPRLEAIHKVTP